MTHLDFAYWIIKFAVEHPVHAIWLEIEGEPAVMQILEIIRIFRHATEVKPYFPGQKIVSPTPGVGPRTSEIDCSVGPEVAAAMVVLRIWKGKARHIQRLPRSHLAIAITQDETAC